MDKIQIIEKLFSYILIYSFLLIPIGLFWGKSVKSVLFYGIAVYGILFFLYLNFYYDLPKSFRKIQQAVYTILEYSFFTWIILYNLRSEKIKKSIKVLSLFFYTFLVAYFIISKSQRMDSIPIGVETILIFLYSFIYFQQFLKYNISKNIYEYPSFWLVAGLILYLGSSFFFNILANHVTSEQIENYWHFTYIPEILKNLLFTMVLLGFPSYNNEYNSKQFKSNDIPNLDMI